MWRELRRGVDDGADVRQLEENLFALGFAPEGMVVDEEFDSDTTTAVRAWQEAQGVDETGSIGPADVVFAPGSAGCRPTSDRSVARLTARCSGSPA